MKQIIMNVLDDMSESQINLASETARETVSSLISAALKTKGSYIEFTDYELDEQEARASWVCDICGENTFEVDSDYIGSGTNHLGCELKSQEEIDEYIEDIDEQAYAQGRGSSMDEMEIRRQKNWLQKKHEDKVFNQAVFGDSRDLTEARIQKNKLSEEIVDNKDEKYIYESPDGGKTVYRRKFGEDERELVTNWKEVNKNNE